MAQPGMLMHLKDLRKGRPTGDLSGEAPDNTCVVLGAGQLNFPAILKAAAKAGVKRYYIEDESPDAPRQVPLSMRYLKSVGF